MAELAEYQQMLRDGVKAGAAGDKRNKYLAHLAQYGVDAPFYGGKAQFTNELQSRYNGMTNGRDIGQSLKLILGSDVDVDGLARKAAQSQRDILVDTVDRAGYYDSQEAVDAARTAPLDPREIQDAKERLLSGSPWLANIDPNKTYAWTTSNNKFHGDDNSVQYGGSRLVEVSHDFDPSKFAGYETIRPGELDNTINGVKEQMGLSDADMERVDWSKIIKYDPTIGLYTPKGAVKHVDDQGGGWAKYGDAWVKTAFATALAAATGGALAPGVGAAVGSATGSTLASTAASVATKALLSSAITAGINGRKLNGRNLLLSAAASGVGAGAGDLVAGATNTAKNGLPALLASGVTRTALLNKGRIDPRLLAANTAGAYADGLLGAPVYSLGKSAYGAYNLSNRLQSNNGQARRPVRVQGRNGGLLSSGVRP